jgi:hypothetical protein
MRFLTLLILLLCSAASNAKSIAVVESRKTQIILRAKNDLIVKEFLRIKILNEDGYRYATYNDYQDKFHKVRSLQYTIFDATGKKIKKLTKGDAVDITQNAFYEITDARLLSLVPAYRNYPFTIEIETESFYNGFLDVPTWMPRDDAGVEVLNAELTFQCPTSLEYRVKELNGAHMISRKEDGEIVTSTWRLENLDAVDKHLSRKSFIEDQPQVRIVPVHFALDGYSGNFTSWIDFGRWYHNLNAGRDLLSPQTKQILDDFKAEFGNDNAAIAKAVYKFMQGKTRYISIQLGIGGFQSLPAHLVDKNGYGDCKALTNYLRSMLGYLKIPSNNVLVRAGTDAPDILTDFPNSEFNHVFLAVPLATDTLWFECTSQNAPPGHLGTFTDDRSVLWVDSLHSKILKTPSYNATQSTRKSVGKVNINQNGDADITIEISQKGLFFDDAMYFQALPKDRLEEFNYQKFDYRDFSIKEFRFSTSKEGTPELIGNYVLSVRGLAKPVAQKMLMPSHMLPSIEQAFELDVVNKKVEVRRPFTIDDKISVTLPENFRIGALPQEIIIENEFGKFSLRYEQEENNILTIFLNAVFQKGNYTREKFDRFHDMLRVIKSAEQSKIVLQSKT